MPLPFFLTFVSWWILCAIQVVACRYRKKVMRRRWKRRLKQIQRLTRCRLKNRQARWRQLSKDDRRSVVTDNRIRSGMRCATTTIKLSWLFISLLSRDECCMGFGTKLLGSGILNFGPCAVRGQPEFSPVYRKTSGKWPAASVRAGVMTHAKRGDFWISLTLSPKTIGLDE